MSEAPPGRLQVWVEGARPRTLAAAVVPVAVGTAASEELVAWRLMCALAAALLLQVAVNYANDLSDGVRGIDVDRAGPRRLVAAGLVPPARMKAAVAVTVVGAAAVSLPLVLAVGPELIGVGALSIAAALTYSGGPSPYASHALGEVFVFVFFGLVATIGSAYVQVDRIVPPAVVAAVPVGFIAAAILVVNNLRDIPSDADAGKRTLAVRLGRDHTRRLFVALIAAAFAALPLVALVDRNPAPLMAVAAAVFAVSPVRVVLGQTGPALVPALGATARLHLVFGLLLAAGLAA